MRYDVLSIVRDSPLYEGCCVYILFSYSPTMSLQLQLCSMVDWQASQRVHRSTLSDLCQKKMSDVTRTVSVLWLVVSFVVRTRRAMQVQSQWQCHVHLSLLSWLQLILCLDAATMLLMMLVVGFN